jgi:hypothetical protein
MADSETPRRIRDDGLKHDRFLQGAIDEERARGELPSYNDDSAADITVNKTGIAAKLGLPRFARQAIGFGFAVLIAALGIAAAVVAVVKALR